MFAMQAELERGDVPKSIQCHMHDCSIPEAMAREDIKALISDTRVEMNGELSPDHHKRFPMSFVKLAMNLARMAQFMYQYGDGHGVPDKETRDSINLLLIEPIRPVMRSIN